MNNVMFPPEYAPYRVISYYGQHVNQGLFYPGMAFTL